MIWLNKKIPVKFLYINTYMNDSTLGDILKQHLAGNSLVIIPFDFPQSQNHGVKPEVTTDTVALLVEHWSPTLKEYLLCNLNLL